MRGGDAALCQINLTSRLARAWLSECGMTKIVRTLHQHSELVTCLSLRHLARRFWNHVFTWTHSRSSSSSTTSFSQFFPPTTWQVWSSFKALSWTITLWALSASDVPQKNEVSVYKDWKVGNARINCHRYGSDNPHRRGVTPMLSAIGCVRRVPSGVGYTSPLSAFYRWGGPIQCMVLRAYASPHQLTYGSSVWHGVIHDRDQHTDHAILGSAYSRHFFWGGVPNGCQIVCSKSFFRSGRDNKLQIYHANFL